MGIFWANCSWQRDRALGTNEHRPVKDPLPAAVIETIRPAFQDLMTDSLLRGCMGAKTQNANESFHHLVWSYVPKEQQHSMEEVRLGVDLAVCVFNKGYVDLIQCFFTAGGLPLSPAAVEAFRAHDAKRIENAKARSSETKQSQRRKSRNTRRARAEAFRRHEGPMYASGQFHGDSKPTRACRNCHKPMKGHPRGRCIET